VTLEVRYGVNLPTLIVISGQPGVGKTTLAHALAQSVACPAICRDELKEGMAHSFPGFVPGPNDPLTTQANAAFFAVLDLLIGNRVTLVAEAAFQDRVWRPALERFQTRAELRVIHCLADANVIQQRIRQRLENPARRSAHADAALLDPNQPPSTFEPISLAVPTLRVDTTAGHHPTLHQITTFARPTPT
jgi:predicted kinase